MPTCGPSKVRPSFARGRPVQRKIVVVGDGGCGKTSLLNRFTRQIFSEVYEPTVFENYVQDIEVDGVPVELSLWDTAGQEEFDRLRSLSYAETHVVMCCFAVDNPTSLDNVEAKWLDEILEFCPGVKLVLVALKCDLRDHPEVERKLSRHGMHPVQYEEGLAVARRIRASRYLECSAKHDRGVNEVFWEASRASLSTRAKGSGSYGGGSCVVT